MVYCQLQPRSVQTTPQGHSAEHWAATRFYTQHLVVRFDCPDLVSLLGSHLAQQTASAAILHQCKRRSHHLSRHRQRTCFDLEVAVCCRKTPSSLQPCHLRYGAAAICCNGTYRMTVFFAWPRLHLDCSQQSLWSDQAGWL